MNEHFREKYGNLTVEECLELNHVEFLKRKNEILSKIETIKCDIRTHRVYRKWLDQIYEFVSERKYE